MGWKEKFLVISHAHTHTHPFLMWPWQLLQWASFFCPGPPSLLSNPCLAPPFLPVLWHNTWVLFPTVNRAKVHVTETMAWADLVFPASIAHPQVSLSGMDLSFMKDTLCTLMCNAVLSYINHNILGRAWQGLGHMDGTHHFDPCLPFWEEWGWHSTEAILWVACLI